jgi:hypothetical protein
LSDTKEMTTGPEISSKTAEAESFEEPTKEELNVAPGLPESGKVAPSSGEKLSIKMPSSGEESQVEQVIVSRRSVVHKILRIEALGIMSC